MVLFLCYYGVEKAPCYCNIITCMRSMLVCNNECWRTYYISGRYDAVVCSHFGTFWQFQL